VSFPDEIAAAFRRALTDQQDEWSTAEVNDV
jgi:hypothetical protein